MAFMTKAKVLDPIGLFKGAVQEYSQPGAEAAAAKAVSGKHGYKPMPLPEDERSRLAKRRSLVSQGRRRGRARTTAMSDTFG